MTKQPALPDKSKFKTLHERIEHHFDSVAELAEDLQEMKATELWRAGGYECWTDYCERGLGKSIRRIQKILRTNLIVKEVLAEIEDKTSVKYSPQSRETPLIHSETDKTGAKLFAPTDQHIVALERDEWLRESVAKLPPEKRVPAIESVTEKGEPLTAKNVAKAAEVGKPIYAMAAWKELEEYIGKAINRTDSVNHLLPNPAQHKSLMADLHSAFEKAERWHEMARK